MKSSVVPIVLLIGSLWPVPISAQQELPPVTVTGRRLDSNLGVLDLLQREAEAAWMEGA